jgi:hypothetical protein
MICDSMLRSSFADSFCTDYLFSSLSKSCGPESRAADAQLRKSAEFESFGWVELTQGLPATLHPRAVKGFYRHVISRVLFGCERRSGREGSIFSGGPPAGFGPRCNLPASREHCLGCGLTISRNGSRLFVISRFLKPTV